MDFFGRENSRNSAYRINFYEIKKNEDRHNAALLEKKVEAFFEKNPQKRELLHSIGPLSLGDM